MKKKVFFASGLLVLISIFTGCLVYMDYWNLLPKRSFCAEDFGIETVTSAVDYDGDGIDDYTDILQGAKIEAEKRPTYDGTYYEGGYPPDEIGVCTDVIWRSLKNAGYSLKDLIDADIAENPEVYPGVNGNPDPNIDFRRVANLQVFFERNVTSLTLDPMQIEEWQPGDIVTYDISHIAIVSDKRNRDGIPYILHNGGHMMREEDALTRHEISGHFRFDLQN